MCQQEKLGLDDAHGNCKQCGHLFNPHIVLAYDTSDFSKGSEIRCPVAGCSCFRRLDFQLKTTPVNSSIPKRCDEWVRSVIRITTVTTLRMLTRSKLTASGVDKSVRAERQCPGV
jgi:hypothetical protein